MLKAQCPSSWKIVELKNNVGPGFARNAGLNVATGQYVWFPDWDDDWMPSILDAMVEAAETQKADVVIVPAERVNEFGTVTEMIDDVDKPIVLNQVDAGVRFLNGRLSGYLWNKLFRRSVLNPDPFPNLRLHEDEVMIERTLATTTRVAWLSTVYYRYIARSGSITADANPQYGTLNDTFSEATELAEKIGADDANVNVAMLNYKYNKWILGTASEASASLSREHCLNELKRVKARVHLSELMKLISVSPAAVLKSVFLRLVPVSVYRSIYRRRHSLPTRD